MSEDFRSCYENYYSVIFRHSAYLTGNVQAAEDIAQETFIKLYNAPPQHSNTGAWLSRVASNLAYNYLRDEKTRKNKEPIIEGYEDSKVISVLGFYFSSMLVAFLTIMASLGSVSSEIESGILHSIITRPIKRAEYILGKYFGLLILSTIYSLLLYTSVILICVFFKMPTFNAIPIATLVKGFLFFALQPIALLSLSIFGSVTFKTVVNGIFVIALYILGLIGSIMEQAGALLENVTLLNLGIFSSLFSPFDVIYRYMISVIFSSIGMPNPMFNIPSSANTTPSNWMFVYIYIYIIGLVMLAVRKFNKKDIS